MVEFLKMTNLTPEENELLARLEGYTEFDYRADPFSDRVYFNEDKLVKINGSWSDMPDYTDWNVLMPLFKKNKLSLVHRTLPKDEDYCCTTGDTNGAHTYDKDEQRAIIDCLLAIAKEKFE